MDIDETRLRDKRFESVKGECVRREYVTLHTPYPLHLTTVRTYTLKIPVVLLKGVMTLG